MQEIRARAPLFGALFLFAAFGACDCDEQVAPIDSGPEPACNLNTNCDEREAFRFGECRPSGCETDLDCCPGTRCRLDFNACVPYQLDPEYDCNTDADCDDPAQRCQTVVLGERGEVQACVYERCEGDLDCGFGRSCYESVCVQTAPCGGACPDSEACDVLTGQCAPVPPASVGCDLACDGLRVLRDPDTMTGDICCEAACECRGLPPIVPTNFGKYARIAVSGDKFLVSAYDGAFGDLVVAHFSAQGEITQVDYIDGIPLGGQIAADPDGPRGGVAEPGPNVGTHTSIGTNAEGLGRVAYHDVDNRLLRVALQNSNGTWTPHTVDAPGDDSGRVGTFTDLAVAADGTIFVSYLAENVTGAPGIAGQASALKIAKSRNSNPTSSTDWEITFADARPAFDPCDGACGATESCIASGGASVCAPTDGTCADCGAAQLCVLQNGVPSCAPNAIPPSAAEFPRARGLYSSIILDGADAVVAYYDSIDQDLRAVRLPDGGQPIAAVIDGDGLDGSRGTDAGRYPAIAQVGNEFLILYEDFTRHEVRAWQGATLGTGGVFSTVDRGKVTNQPGKRFVGATLAVANQNGNAPFIVYQDASTLDLKTGRLNGADWTLGTLLEDGPHGFYSDVVISGTNAFIVSVLAELDARGRERARLGMTTQALP